MRRDQIIIKPLITEKSTGLTSSKVYVFQVHSDANKYQVAEQLNRMYGATVESVRVMIQKGKSRRAGRRSTRKPVSPIKKAYITISKGSIPAFPQM